MLFYCFLFIFQSFTLISQDNEKNAAALATALAYGTFQTSILISGFVKHSLVATSVMTGSFLQTLPLIALSPGEGTILSGLTAASFAGYLSLDEPELLKDSMGDAGIKIALWSNYRSYSYYRELSDSLWEPESFNDLYFAAFDWEDMNHPAVWTVLGLGALTNAGFSFLSAESDQGVFNTGKTYLGEKEVPVILGISAVLGVGLINNMLTGATEEALYRGVQYEELQNTIGRPGGRVLDALIFSGIHIPGDIYQGMNSSDIIVTALYRVLITLGLQWAYDSAGLQSSSGLHAWLNVSSELAEYLVTGGVAQSSTENNLSINQLSLQWGFKY